MKKFLFILTGLCAFLALMPQWARAQDPPPVQDQPARRARTPDDALAMLDSKLALSDDQKEKIKPIIADRQKRIRELSETSGRRMRRGRKMKAIFEESDKKIMAVLNDDQKQKYKEIEQQMREHAKQRRKDRDN